VPPAYQQYNPSNASISFGPEYVASMDKVTNMAV
jgi:hypothetical protein